MRRDADGRPSQDISNGWRWEVRVDISQDPKATHYCACCGLTMKAREVLDCPVRDGDLCEAKKRVAKKAKPRVVITRDEHEALLQVLFAARPFANLVSTWGDHKRALQKAIDAADKLAEKRRERARGE